MIELRLTIDQAEALSEWIETAIDLEDPRLSCDFYPYHIAKSLKAGALAAKILGGSEEEKPLAPTEGD